jgi:hypothetical protein
MNCPTRTDLLDAVNGLGDGSRVRDHVAACAACRPVYDGLMGATEVLSRTPPAPPPGPCLSDSRIIGFARKGLPPERLEAAEEHLAACPKCLEEAAALAETLSAEGEEAPEDLRRRILRIVPETGSGVRRSLPARALPVRRPAPTWVWLTAAAAAFALVVFFLSLPGGAPTLPVVREKAAPRPAVRDEARPEEPRPPPPAPEPQKEEPKVAVEAPKKEDPRPAAPEAPKPDPTPVVTTEPAKTVPRPEPKPAVAVEPPKAAPKPDTRVEPPKGAAAYLPVRVAGVNGMAALRSGAKVAPGMSLGRQDEVYTDHRHLSALTLEGGVVATLDRSTGFTVERVEGGETRLSLRAGTAFFKVDKRTQPFVVATSHADAVVTGTAFQVDIDARQTVLHVVEGAIRFRNEKGEVLVQAGQRSIARKAEKPSAPVRLLDPNPVVAWARRPDLAGDSKAELWMEHVQGGSRKHPGLVIAAPYHEGEVHAGKLARALSESMDAGLLLGHNHRDRQKVVWMNIDRGTEVEMADPASNVRAPAKSTPRAKKTLEEYLSHLRGAAGVGPKQPAPMVVCLRNHSTTAVAGGELEVCEVAWIGWDRRTIADLKKLYGALLDRHKPAYRVEMRFEDLDATYPHKGQTQNFQFTESDAEGEGYMAPSNSRAAIAFFFNPSSWKNADDVEVYAKILSEMVDFLWSRKR